VIKNWSFGDCHGDLPLDLFPVELYGKFVLGFWGVVTKKIKKQDDANKGNSDNKDQHANLKKVRRKDT